MSTRGEVRVERLPGDSHRSPTVSSHSPVSHGCSSDFEGLSGLCDLLPSHGEKQIIPRYETWIHDELPMHTHPLSQRFSSSLAQLHFV